MPDDVLASDRYRSSRQFAEYVRKAGLPEAAPVPMTVDWDVVRRELRGEQRPLISRGDVLIGTNGAGKHSLDTNYLPAAEATGRLDLRPLHDVTSVRRDDAGRWIVDVDVLDGAARLVERLRITTDALFLGAGTMNTTKLLLKARDTGALPDLPDDLGRYWGTNGDLLVTAVLRDRTGTWQGGPANVATLDWDNPDGPVTLLFAALPFPAETHAMQLVGMVIPDGHGSMTYDSARDRLRIVWPKEADAGAMTIARARMRRLTRAAGAVTVFDATRSAPSTFHQLGGAVIGKVCDPHGRVLGQRGLYVTDGALIPGSTACANPSLTIAALAERNAATVVADDVGSVF
ncbi:MAG: GMC oxidoreductase [Baekduiaceae bacterium]